jgi:hypothetical protein
MTSARPRAAASFTSCAPFSTPSRKMGSTGAIPCKPQVCSTVMGASCNGTQWFFVLL